VLPPFDPRGCDEYDDSHQPEGEVAEHVIAKQHQHRGDGDRDERTDRGDDPKLFAVLIDTTIPSRVNHDFGDSRTEASSAGPSRLLHVPEPDLTDFSRPTPSLPVAATVARQQTGPGPWLQSTSWA